MKPTVAIVGVGLIGGSLGMALRKSRRYRVIGIGRNIRRLREAKRRGAVDRIATQLSAAAAADLVVIASPVDTIAPTFKRLLPYLKPGAVVSDVGSVKGSVMEQIAQVKHPRSIHFVGAHPLAGSHETGVKAAHSRLFERSTVVLVPEPHAPLKPLKSLWRAVGANVVVLAAAEHDRAVALISHLPHLVAHALVHLLANQRDRRRLIPLLAGSFRDATRVAASDAEQWRQILHANRQPLKRSLQSFRRELSRLETALSRRSLKSHLRKSHAFRRSLFNGI